MSTEAIAKLAEDLKHGHRSHAGLLEGVTTRHGSVVAHYR